MGRLTIQDVIEHCEKTVKQIERNLEMYRNWLELEPMTTNVKRYLEHKQTAEWLKELQHYKDLEEQGRLICLPCKVGDTVWRIATQHNNYDDSPYKIVMQSSFRLDYLNEMGKTVFLAKKEAEAKLKELKEGVE